MKEKSNKPWYGGDKQLYRVLVTFGLEGQKNCLSKISYDQCVMMMWHELV